jgi:hypothetical protein
MSDTSRARKPAVIVGAAGHRDLHADGVPQLQRYVDDFLSDVRQHLPNTELRIMTGMAHGADLLVVRAALQAGWKIDAALPLPLQRHLEDFDSESAAELRAVLADPAVTCTVLPAPAGADIDAKHGAGRSVFYSNLTQALIESTDLLLAIWDGTVSSRPGGTADTVRRYLEVGSHFVYWIPAQRSGTVDSASGGPTYLSGVGDTLQHFGSKMPHALERQLQSVPVRARP